MNVISTILIMIVSFLATLVVLSLCLCILYFARGGGIQLSDGLPGAFDDSEAFRKREAAALELMTEESRQSYLLAKRWIAQHKPNSANTDITLSQYLTIQEKAVNAWEFEANVTIQAATVQNRTEITFYEGVTCVQANLPLPKQNDVYYFETKIFQLPRGTTLSIGLCTKPYPLFRPPGMHLYSVAYDSTGYRRLNQPFEAKQYGRPWEQGDVIGVGYRTYSGTVFFTHNGKKLEDVVQGMRVNLFPSVGATGPAHVVVNLGQAGFVFVEGQVKKWGLAPAQGTLAPPPAYGEQQDSVLLELENPPSPPRVPPSFDEGMGDAIGMARLPPPYNRPRRIDARPGVNLVGNQNEAGCEDSDDNNNSSHSTPDPTVTPPRSASPQPTLQSVLLEAQQNL